MKHTILGLTALLIPAGPAFSQHQHFEDFKWREKETDHFALRASGTNHDPARKYAEDVWEVCVEVMPKLEDDFGKNEFRTPGGSKGADTAPYRFTVYLVGSGHDYDKVLEQEQKRSGWDANQLRLCRMTRNYGDPQCRYVVLCKADPESTGGGGETDLTAVFVHNTASTILGGRSLSGNLPLWMSAGWGYYVEHRVFRLCRVLYLDFDAYYNDKDNAEIKKGGVLDPSEAWTGPLRKMCKKGVRVSLEMVCSAEITTLTPNESGYIFALTYFLVSTEERLAKYREFIAKIRGGAKPDKALLLKTYGYEDDAALEKDWYEFMESSKFR